MTQMAISLSNPNKKNNNNQQKQLQSNDSLSLHLNKILNNSSNTTNNSLGSGNSNSVNNNIINQNGNGNGNNNNNNNNNNVQISSTPFGNGFISFAQRQKRSIACFSGGSAMNAFVSVIQNITDETAYIMPVSDDGGSTSEIIRVLGGPGIGDLRSRLVRLADTKGSEARAVHDLLCYRLPMDSDLNSAKTEWMEILEGTHRLWLGISPPYKETIRAFLAHFYHETVRAASRSTFDFQGGSIGNFFLTGSRLFFGNLDAAIFQVARIMRITPKTAVLPVLDTVRGDVAIAALLRDGSKIHGQCEISHPGSHNTNNGNREEPLSNYVTAEEALINNSKPVKNINNNIINNNKPSSCKRDASPSGKTCSTNLLFSKDANDQPHLNSAIRRIYYTNYEKYEVYPTLNTLVSEHLEAKSTIIYGCGSLYTSIVPCLIVPGVAHYIVKKETVPRLNSNPQYGSTVMDYLYDDSNIFLNSIKKLDTSIISSNEKRAKFMFEDEDISPPTISPSHLKLDTTNLPSESSNTPTSYMKDFDNIINGTINNSNNSNPSIGYINGNANNSTFNLNSNSVSGSRYKKILLLNGSEDRETSGFSALDFVLAITDALNYSYLVKEALDENEEYRNHEHSWEVDDHHNHHRHHHFYHVPRSSPTDDNLNRNSSVSPNGRNGRERSYTDNFPLRSNPLDMNSNDLSTSPKKENQMNHVLGSYVSLNGASTTSLTGHGAKKGKINYYQLLANRYRREAKKWLESSNRENKKNGSSYVNSSNNDSTNDSIYDDDEMITRRRGLSSSECMKPNSIQSHKNKDATNLSRNRNDLHSTSSLQSLSSSMPHNKSYSRQYSSQSPNKREGYKTNSAMNNETCTCDICRAIDEEAPLPPWNVFIKNAFMESNDGRSYLIYPNPPHKYITHMVFPENGHLNVEIDRILSLKIECIKVPFIKDNSNTSNNNNNNNSTNFSKNSDNKDSYNNSAKSQNNDNAIKFNSISTPSSTIDIHPPSLLSSINKKIKQLSILGNSTGTTNSSATSLNSSSSSTPSIKKGNSYELRKSFDFSSDHEKLQLLNKDMSRNLYPNYYNSEKMIKSLSLNSVNNMSADIASDSSSTFSNSNNTDNGNLNNVLVTNNNCCESPKNNIECENDSDDNSDNKKPNSKSNKKNNWSSQIQRAVTVQIASITKLNGFKSNSNDNMNNNNNSDDDYNNESGSDNDNLGHDDETSNNSRGRHSRCVSENPKVLNNDNDDEYIENTIGKLESINIVSSNNNGSKSNNDNNKNNNTSSASLLNNLNITDKDFIDGKYSMLGLRTVLDLLVT